MRECSRQQGVALITVVLVLLVLTVMGLAISVMMTREDRTSARLEHQKAAFYAAEAGLRRAEGVMRTTSLGDAGVLLGHVAVAQTPVVQPQVPVHPIAGQPLSWDAARLGTYLTAAGAELANQEVPLAGVPGSAGRRAFFSAYIRNNPDDPGGPVANQDSRLRLISVGWVAGANGVPLAVKILEEEFNYTGSDVVSSGQIGGRWGGGG